MQCVFSVFAVTDQAIIGLSTHCLLNPNYGICCPCQMTMSRMEGTAYSKIPTQLYQVVSVNSFPVPKTFGV